jgi:hypothetical protein
LKEFVDDAQRLGLTRFPSPSSPSSSSKTTNYQLKPLNSPILGLKEGKERPDIAKAFQIGMKDKKLHEVPFPFPLLLFRLQIPFFFIF